PLKLAHHVLEKLIRGGRIVAEGDIVRLAGHKVSLAGDQQTLRDALLAAHRAPPLVPPNHTELFGKLGITAKQAQPLFQVLVAEGVLVKINEELYFPADVMEDLRGKVRAWFETHEEISPGDFRDITTISRKNGVALLEHFDKEQITMRVGDRRVLRRRRA
ncbi:MAG: SelB C-terminal domain-containing protein, partial [Mailhella sp.]|nr:SelB C-terminal domain-containing protein [Mailhella sp.]